MTKEGEIVITLETPQDGPYEVKLEFGESFQKVLPDLNNPQKMVPELTKMIKEMREALRAITSFVELIGEYRQDLRTLLELIRALGESQNDLKKIIQMWTQAAGSTSSSS